MFIHLRGHSTFSFLEGIGKIDEILDICQTFEMPAMALTEYYTMAGAVPFFQKATKKGIKPIIGVELGFVYDYKTIHLQKHVGLLTFIAKNTDGYQALLRLVTTAHNHKYEEKPILDVAMLEQELITNKTKGSFYVLVGGEQSCIGTMIAKYEEETKIRDLWTLIQNTVGPDSFIADIIVQPYTKEKNLKHINDYIQKLATETNTPLLANSNFHYPKKEDKEVFEVALAIKDGKKMYDPDRRKVFGDYHLCNEEYIVQTMLENGYDEQTIKNILQTNITIANTINITIPLGQKLFPVYQTPPDILALYEKYKDQLVIKSQ